MHSSGGSWSEHLHDGRQRRFRRDTHDDVVEAAVLDLLRVAVPRCPSATAVILERIGGTLDRDSGPRYRDDFARIRDTVRDLASTGR